MLSSFLRRPSLATVIVPRSSDTTRTRASERSAKPKAAVCRNPRLPIFLALKESGKRHPNLTTRSSVMTAAPSWPTEWGSKRLSRRASLTLPSKGVPPLRCRSRWSAPVRTIKAPNRWWARSVTVWVRTSICSRDDTEDHLFLILPQLARRSKNSRMSSWNMMIRTMTRTAKNPWKTKTVR